MAPSCVCPASPRRPASHLLRDERYGTRDAMYPASPRLAAPLLTFSSCAPFLAPLFIICLFRLESPRRAFVFDLLRPCAASHPFASNAPRRALLRLVAPCCAYCSCCALLRLVAPIVPVAPCCALLRLVAPIVPVAPCCALLRLVAPIVPRLVAPCCALLRQSFLLRLVAPCCALLRLSFLLRLVAPCCALLRLISRASPNAPDYRVSYPNAPEASP